MSLQTVSQGYNYNSGVPSSPPPSFRTSTTRLTPSTLQSLNAAAACTDPTPPYPSTMAPSERGDHNLLGAEWSGTTVEPPTSTAATLMSLHTRIAQLEESLGRLLLEREQWQRDIEAAGDPNHRRDNCCAILPEDEPSLRTRGNCCVNVVPRHNAEMQERRQKKIMLFVLSLAFTGCLFAWLIVMTNGKKPKHD